MAEPLEHDGHDGLGDDGASSVWVVFGDLMSGVLGLFILFFAWVMLFQLDLVAKLEKEQGARAETAQRLAQIEHAKAAQTRRMAALEAALATPLKSGSITLSDTGSIGIAGSVLFDYYSADLRPEGVELLRRIALPLRRFLETEDEMVMVGGFTDDLTIHGRFTLFKDNWELSAERALTVVRTLADSGVPPERLFAAGFGAHHPAVPNTDETSRAKNRRVEIVPQARKRSETP